MHSWVLPMNLFKIQPRNKRLHSRVILWIYTPHLHTFFPPLRELKLKGQTPSPPKQRWTLPPQHRNPSWHEVSTSHPCFGGEGVTSNFRARKKKIFWKKFFVTDMTTSKILRKNFDRKNRKTRASPDFSSVPRLPHDALENFMARS